MIIVILQLNGTADYVALLGVFGVNVVLQQVGIDEDAELCHVAEGRDPAVALLNPTDREATPGTATSADPSGGSPHAWTQ